MDIKVGDIVMWYETGHTARKQGQVIQISVLPPNATLTAGIWCDKDSCLYNVPVKNLKKV